MHSSEADSRNFKHINLDMGININSILSSTPPRMRPFYKAFHETNPKAFRHFLKNQHGYDKFLTGEQKRFLVYNGLIGPEQLSWLDTLLQDKSKH